MKGMQVQGVMGEMEQGKCRGNWDIAARACSKCYIRQICEAETKRRKIEEEDVVVKDEIIDEPSSDERISEVTPMEFIIGTLGGKYDYTTKENDAAKADLFKKDGRVIVEILTSKKTGKIKIRSSKGIRCLDKIGSMEEAEDILGELPV